MNDIYQGLGLVELLDLLEPAPVPPDISMTPQTPGWIVLGLVLAAVLAVAVRRVWLHRRASAYRRAALAELKGTGNDPAALSVLVRRTALAAFARPEVAGLSGDDWLSFLDRSYGGSGFSDGPGRVLATASARPDAGHDPELVTLVGKWIRTHRTSRGDRR